MLLFQMDKCVIYVWEKYFYIKIKMQYCLNSKTEITVAICKKHKLNHKLTSNSSNTALWWKYAWENILYTLLQTEPSLATEDSFMLTLKNYKE